MNYNTFISGMVKLCQTPDLSSLLFVPEANLINTSLFFWLLINPSVFPLTLRTFSFHQFELSIIMPQKLSSKDTSPCLLKFWHELVEDWYSGVRRNMLVLQKNGKFWFMHPTGTVTVNLMETVSPSLTR